MTMQGHKMGASAAAWALLLLLPGALSADTASFQYDALDRLVQVTYADGRSITFSYDADGNRTRKITTGDLDNDGIPDAIDPDIDGDGVPNAQDAFPLNPNEWLDTDHDGIGNNADTDDDNDGVPDPSDNCPLVANPNQADADRNGVGDACEATPNFCWECLPNRGGWRAILR